MITKALSDVGLRGWHLHAASLGAIYLCVALWIRAKTVDQEERGNAERRAIFVGLWPPMLWLMGNALQLEERTALHRRAVRRVSPARLGTTRSWIARTGTR
jgi:hypothetical protein